VVYHTEFEHNLQTDGHGETNTGFFNTPKKNNANHKWQSTKSWNSQIINPTKVPNKSMHFCVVMSHMQRGLAMD